MPLRFEEVLPGVLAILLVVGAMPVAADTTFHLSCQPTPGLDDPEAFVRTLTITLTIDSNDPELLIRAVEADFRGLFNQVHPGGWRTAFTDNNPILDFIYGGSLRDSQFLLSEFDDLAAPPLAVVDESDRLSAAMVLAPQSQSSRIDLLQVVTGFEVTPSLATGGFSPPLRGELLISYADASDPSVTVRQQSILYIAPLSIQTSYLGPCFREIPEPGTLLLMIPTITAASAICRRER